MFNQTYKQISGNIQRKDINETLKFSYSNFFTKFGVFILAMGSVIMLYAIGIGPTQGNWGETGNMVARILLDIVGPLVKVSDGIFFLMLLAWVIMPYYNRGAASVQGSLIGLIWVITTFFSISSIITLVLVIVQGWISFFVQLFIIFMYLCVSTYIWIMKVHGKETKISNLKMTITTLALMLIINIVMVIYSVIVKHLNFELALGSASVILYILLIFLLFYQLDRVYKMIYIQKYNRQFRVAYKIPDKKWWFTAKRAAKQRGNTKMDDNESSFSYKTYLWGIVGFIVFALIYTPLVWLPIIKNRLQTGVGNSTLFWIVNCIGVIPFIAVYGLIKAMFKKWRKEKGSK